MILISHRGNITRPIPERENDPKYVHEAIVNGFEVEVDVWFIKGKFKIEKKDISEYVKNHSNKQKVNNMAFNDLTYELFNY